MLRKYEWIKNDHSLYASQNFRNTAIEYFKRSALKENTIDQMY